MNNGIKSNSASNLPPQNSARDTSNWDDKAFTMPNPKAPVAMFNMEIVEERSDTVPWNKLPDLTQTDVSQDNI